MPDLQPGVPAEACPCRALPRVHKAWEHGEPAGVHTVGQHRLIVEGTIELP